MSFIITFTTESILKASSEIIGHSLGRTIWPSKQEGAAEERTRTWMTESTGVQKWPLSTKADGFQSVLQTVSLLSETFYPYRKMEILKQRPSVGFNQPKQQQQEKLPTNWKNKHSIFWETSKKWKETQEDLLLSNKTTLWRSGNTCEDLCSSYVHLSFIESSECRKYRILKYLLRVGVLKSQYKICSD